MHKADATWETATTTSLSPMLVRKKGGVRGGGGSRNAMLIGSDRASWMARYYWDGKERGGGHGLVSF